MKERKTDPSRSVEKLKRKVYEHELAKLHAELVSLQKWIVDKGLKVCIVFEGRDGAGKGGTIKAITERVSPRVYHVVALSVPTEREKSQMYFQRYVPHLPSAGEITIFDRSWYNRAGVERVMGFCTEEQAKRFLEIVPEFEHLIVESGTVLLKYWLEVSPDEQTRRLEARINDGRKTWKLSPMDLDPTSNGTIIPMRAMRCSRRATPLGTMVRRAIGRQEARETECHPPSAGPYSLRDDAGEEGEAAQATACGSHGVGPSFEICSGARMGGDLAMLNS